MRYTIGQVWRRPSEWGCWWEDLPYRRRSWWWELLFAPGEGWLKWASEYRERIFYDPPDIDQWYVYPPLRRGWMYVSGWRIHLWYGVIRRQWEWNAWPSFHEYDMLKSEDRKRLFR